MISRSEHASPQKSRSFVTLSVRCRYLCAENNNAIVETMNNAANMPSRANRPFPCAPAGLQTPGQQIGLFVGVCAAFLGISAVVGRAARIGGVGGQAAATPPPVAFAIVWPVLYACMGCAVSLQCLGPVKHAPQLGTTGSASGASRLTTPCAVPPAVQWGGLAALLTAVILTFVWPPVFVRGYNSTSALLIVAMLALGGIGTILASKTSTIGAVLVVPLLAWLVFALVLTCQTAQVQADRIRL